MKQLSSTRVLLQAFKSASQTRKEKDVRLRIAANLLKRTVHIRTAVLLLLIALVLGVSF